MSSVEGEEFKKLRPADALAICALEKEAFSLPWSLEQIVRSLNQDSFAAWGVWQENKLLAYVSFYHFEIEMEIINLAVDAKFRRKGIGTRLLKALLQASAKMGVKKIILEVREGNLPAIALYKKIGFQLAGLRKNYYPDTSEDALIYSVEF